MFGLRNRPVANERPEPTSSMSRVLSGLLIPVLALAVEALPLRAQTPGAPAAPSYRHRLLGVFNAQTGDPVEGAEVVDVMQRVSALTTKTGTVTLVFLPEGGSLLKIQKIGFEPTSLVVAISPADTLPVTIMLNPAAQVLPTMVTKDSAPHYISPGLRAFEERRKTGMGHFIAGDELRKNDNSTMTNVIRRFPGVEITCITKGIRQGSCVAASMRQRCASQVYIDGVPSTDNDLQKIKVDEFAGVEYYAGGATTPPQYNRTGSACGVLLFWSRER
ncbi:MAG: hypothetical protein JWM41_4344 [Gemmatimonadetes bacterium]|nr:hypothetical protein [Gemmatimonadota bacterium]